MSQSLLHPSVAELTAFSVGQLSLDAAAKVEGHIGECQPCCDTLLQLSADDTFVALLQDCKDPVDGSTLDLSNTEQSEQDLEITLQSALDEHTRYEIVELIGKGGMGKVFKARHRIMERTVAIKVINAKLMCNPEAVERFHREVKTAACLSHPNIVAAHDAEQADGIHFLVMEYVDGVNLAQWVSHNKPLPIEEACEYVRQAAVGLQYAHERGMVHRDIKPHNLMRTTAGTIKILDFGLASLAETTLLKCDHEQPLHPSLTAIGAVMGTPDFISPEQAADAHQADIRSDIYSLGATLHYLLCGQPPFTEGSVKDKLKRHAETKPESVSQLRTDVPQDLSDLISRMMSKNPEERFQTPQEVAIALAFFAKKQPNEKTLALNTVTNKRSSRWPAFKHMAVAGGALALMLAGLVFVKTDHGTLVVESIDSNVIVQIRKAANATSEEDLEMSVVDTVTGSKVVRLPSGTYEVTLVDDRNEYKLSEGGFTLSRGGQIVVKVTRNDNVELHAEAKGIKSIPRMNLSPQVQQSLWSQGTKLSKESAKELQARADNDPHDIESRLQLLGFYFSNRSGSQDFQKRRLDLVCWIIENYPDSEVAGRSDCEIDAILDPSGYLRAKTLWLHKVKENERNVVILSNAAEFLRRADPMKAEELLNIAQALEPDNVALCDQLGQFYRLGLISNIGRKERKELAEKSLRQFERSMILQGESTVSSSTLIDLAKIAFEAGETEKANRFAEQVLKSPSGNAVHSGNIVLGRLALKSGKVEDAGKYLLAAGNTSGSPNLNSFGPNMMLAKELLEIGQKEVVLEYFKLCNNFWKNDQLQQWTDIVKKDGTPDFGGNLFF